MDGNVRIIIKNVINMGLIDVCHGVVKEGKEAIVYHGESTSSSSPTTSSTSSSKEELTMWRNTQEEELRKDITLDVAIKVFKRISEFKTRGKYVDGDARYHGQKFNRENKRDQVELWAEKEYRNLLRANKAGVPVPTPLLQRENVLFMRFLGEDGWPSPQLREIDIKKGSKKWITLYGQIMIAVRRLYHCARLVHGDLSEYNILICPSILVENGIYSRQSSSNNEETEDAESLLQIVLIDFGQAVEIGHPASFDLLRRDLSMVNAFFKRQGVRTLEEDEAEAFVLREHDGVDHDDDDDEEEDEKKEDWEDKKEEKIEMEEKTVAPMIEVVSAIDADSTIAASSSIKEDGPEHIDTKETTELAASTAKCRDEESVEPAEESLLSDQDNEDEEDDDGAKETKKKKSTWRNIIHSWDDDKDLEMLMDMLRAKKNKKSSN
mmetsp:Transcript_7814/g.10926  ORF Transcript_7814/g.10926 Transcript_7814/m.10926 type:complete len:436 (-) Transcript_7814:103-1410(-)